MPPSTTSIEKGAHGVAGILSRSCYSRKPARELPIAADGDTDYFRRRDRNALRGAGAHSAYGSAWLLKKLTKLSGAQGG